MQYSKTQPFWHFVILSLATANIYQLYWFYKNWTFFKKKENSSLRPSWRALFAIFYIWGLGKRMNSLLKKENIGYKVPTIVVGTGWILISSCSNLPDPWWLLYSLAFVPLLPMVHAMNLYWAKQEKHVLPVKPFEVWQKILIGLGLIFFALAVIGVTIDVLMPGYLDS